MTQMTEQGGAFEGLEAGRASENDSESEMESDGSDDDDEFVSDDEHNTAANLPVSTLHFYTATPKRCIMHNEGRTEPSHFQCADCICFAGSLPPNHPVCERYDGRETTTRPLLLVQHRQSRVSLIDGVSAQVLARTPILPFHVYSISCDIHSGIVAMCGGRSMHQTRGSDNVAVLYFFFDEHSSSFRFSDAALFCSMQQQRTTTMPLMANSVRLCRVNSGNLLLVLADQSGYVWHKSLYLLLSALASNELPCDATTLSRNLHGGEQWMSTLLLENQQQQEIVAANCADCNGSTIAAVGDSEHLFLFGMQGQSTAYGKAQLTNHSIRHLFPRFGAQTQREASQYITFNTTGSRVAATLYESGGVAIFSVDNANVDVTCDVVLLTYTSPALPLAFDPDPGEHDVLVWAEENGLTHSVDVDHATDALLEAKGRFSGCNDASIKLDHTQPIFRVYAQGEQQSDIALAYQCIFPRVTSGNFRANGICFTGDGMLVVALLDVSSNVESGIFFFNPLHHVPSGSSEKASDRGELPPQSWRDATLTVLLGARRTPEEGDEKAEQSMLQFLPKDCLRMICKRAHNPLCHWLTPPDEDAVSREEAR